MTVEQMSKVMYQRIRDYGHVSFVELQREIGDESKGMLAVGPEEHPNLLYWAGMSQKFVEALERIRPKIEPTPSSLLVYMIDGGLPKMPVAKRWMNYKKPHWLPITFNAKNPDNSPEETRRIMVRDAKLLRSGQQNE